MALTSFIDKVTTITHTWLNKIDTLFVTVFDEAQTKADARTALNVPSNSEAVLITGAQTITGAKTFTDKISSTKQQAFEVVAGQPFITLKDSADANKGWLLQSLGGEYIFKTDLVGTGTFATRARISEGLRVGSPTGGDKGIGSINASTIYQNNVAVVTEGDLATTAEINSGTAGTKVVAAEELFDSDVLQARFYNVFKDMSAAQIADVKAETALVDVLAALEASNTACGTGKYIQYFPKGKYGITDTFHNAAGVSLYFEPGAEIVLMNATTGGAAFGTTPSDGSQTDQIDIWNLSIDCDNIAGENAFGVSGSAGARIWNARARNTLHDATTQGGKGFQIEGVGANRVQVVGLTLDNCSIGIDLHPFNTDVANIQTVGISIRDVHMTDVDVPFTFSDSFQAAPANSWDAFDVHISNVRGRNCGRITWAGGTALGGGIIVADRAYKAKFDDMLFVNDAGGFGSTAYGQIGALVRGTPFEFHLNDVVLVADVTHLFDFNFSAVGSPSTASLASYVLADNVRHYGDLTNVVATKSGGGALGQCILTNIEYDSTETSFAGLVDANAAAYTNAFMDARDRAAVTESGTRVVSTGLRTLKELSDYGNGAEDFFRPSALGEYKFSHRKADVADAVATALFSVLTAHHSRFSIRYQITAFTDSSAASGNAITISGIVAVSRDGQNNITLGTPVNTSESEALDGITTWTLTPAVATSTNEVEFRVTQDNDLNQTADVIVDATIIFSAAETAQQPVVSLL